MEMNVQITKNWFETYSAKTLIMVGVLFFILGSLAAYFFHGRYDGVMDMHLVDSVKIYEPFLDNSINTLCLFLTLFIVGRMINGKTRAIDILATVLVARCVFYVLPLFNINNFLKSRTELLMATLDEPNVSNLSLPNIPVADLLIILFFALLSMVFLVCFIVLLFRGFKTATNLKTGTQKLYFALAILAAEVISKVIFYSIHS